MQRLKKEMNQMPKLPEQQNKTNKLNDESKMLNEMKGEKKAKEVVVLGAEFFKQGETRDFVGNNIRNAKKKNLKPF